MRNTKITVTDDGVNQVENLRVEVAVGVPQSIKILNDDGSTEEKTINVLQTKMTTTLSDLKRSLSDKEGAITAAQTNLDNAQKDFDDTQALIEEIEGQVTDLPARTAPAQE